MSGPALAELLDHPRLGATLGRAPQLQVVHEAPHEEDATAARLEQVFWCERISDLDRVEPLPLVHDPNDQRVRFEDRLESKLDDDPLGLIVGVAVLDGVDDRFACRDADSVHRIFVETTDLTHVIAEQLDEIQHVEVTGKFETDRMPDVRHVRERDYPYHISFCAAGESPRGRCGARPLNV